ncbi:cupin domain-containing protein [Amycolatopsis pithecellobii]|uniref:Cupin domain-containing protein n=1 Tax=Amycolatopsis pithecellobii TaxID=664692 RepID=A0A6N7YQY6_9PSEU|nr:cupin domain-containing protein [Amycolatopsis pithecellobii]MTD54298.1 cupin domain-containing protein [Amycolatopsis pithecellobii]
MRELNMTIRRVATGHNAEGKAVFASDVELEHDGGGGPIIYQIWAGDYKGVHLPDDGSEPAVEDEYFPRTGGFRFLKITTPPNGAAPVPEPASGTFTPRRPMRYGFDADFPEGAGMHKTASIDLMMVLSGELTLELDDGASKTVKAGNTIIQNGTKHRWINNGDVPAVMVAVIIGVDHDDFA